MEPPPVSNTLINLEDFPSYKPPAGQSKLIPHTADYLKLLVDTKLSNGNRSVELPSLSLLADFFNCSHLAIYDIFRALQLQGYDYQFSSLDRAVLVWKNTLDEKESSS